jgi:GxxExxY protein
MEHKELTEKIIGCAFRVYNQMGFGFLESVYEKCMLIELEKAGLQAQGQHSITVYYEDTAVGEFAADILIGDAVIVELKSVRRLTLSHEVQLVNYLTATGKSVGLLLNYGEEGVEVKRKVRLLKARGTEQEIQ